MSLWPALLGGVLIGASALLLYAAFGRIAGISGIAFGTLFGAAAERPWRLLFLGGLVLGGWLAVVAGTAKPLAPLPEAGGLVLIVLAGLLVGIGTRLGNGCTSGHGVCGLARLSRRSLVSVLLFMGAGILSASLLRPLLVGLAP